jgi:hypothetical protein
VERVVAEKIGRETVTYVSNIYKDYVPYTLTLDEMAEGESEERRRRIASRSTKLEDVNRIAQVDARGRTRCSKPRIRVSLQAPGGVLFRA